MEAGDGLELVGSSIPPEWRGRIERDRGGVLIQEEGI